MKYLVLTFSIIILFAVTPSVWAQNLLQNPGFETWIDDSTCQYWYTETTAIDAVKESGTVHSGSFSAKLVLWSTSTQRFTQYVSPITPGNDYEFSFWCFDNDPYGRVRVTIRWYDGAGGLISGYYGNYSSDSTDWQQLVSGPQSAPASAETAHVEVRMYDVTGFTDSAIVYVDEASFVDLGTGTPPETLTIYQIQGQATSSPWEDSTVVTFGIVTGLFGSDFFIEEQPGGAWHGIYVYGSSNIPTRGDSVRVTGVVTEYYGMTELTGPIVNVLQSSVSIPGPSVLQTGSVPVEDYESVLVRVVNATCTNDSLGYGEWEVNDGSGPVRIDDMGVTYVPDSGQIYTVTGPLNYGYGNFKIEPRDSNDIVAGGGVSEISETKCDFFFTVFPTISKRDVNINLSLKKIARTAVSIYSISGRKTEILFSDELNAGKHVLVWNTKNVSQGIYFIKVNSALKTDVRKVLIIR